MQLVAAVFIGAVLIPLLAWRLVGARRKRDPLLLPWLIVSLGFMVAGLGELLLEGEWFDWKLLFGVLGLAVFATRWRATRVAREPAA